MTRFKFTADQADNFDKHGVNLTVYGENVPQASPVHVSVEKGHFQEFFDNDSYFMYYIL